MPGELIKNALGLSVAYSFSHHSTNVDLNGGYHTRYKQTINNVPIWGKHLILHSKKELYLATGSVYADVSVDTLPTKTESEIRDISIQDYSAKSLIKGDKLIFDAEEIELNIAIDDHGESTLVYHVDLFSVELEGLNSPAQPNYLIDANTGKIIEYWDGLRTSSLGTGPGGNLKTGQYEYGSGISKFDVAVSGSSCTMENSNVRTADYSDNNGNNPFTYGCYRNAYKYKNGAYSPINDAHAFGNIIFDMYSSWYGISPLTTKLKLYVHYGTNVENAYYSSGSMFFGDGLNTFHPLVSLDVTAHEVAHGVTDRYSDLIYSNQSGGINEAFSDIAGEAAEYYRNSSNDWKVGFDIYKSPSGALRYMDNPTQKPPSIDHASNYYDGLDVHYSSGIFNKAFYLIATSPGWTTQKAFDIFLAANQNYWQPSSTFNSAACGVMHAANDRGYYTYSVPSIITAFSQVGVICPNPPPPSNINIVPILYLLLLD